MRVRHAGRLAEVTERRAGSTLTLDQERTLAGGRSDSQLIESQDFATSSQDAAAGLLGDAQGAQLQLGNLQDAGIIGDGSNGNHDGVLAGALFREACDALQR